MQYINTVLYKYLHFYKFNLLVLQVRITLLGGCRGGMWGTRGVGVLVIFPVLM